jgi:hypothetical protein
MPFAGPGFADLAVTAHQNNHEPYIRCPDLIIAMLPGTANPPICAALDGLFVGFVRARERRVI